MRLANAFLVVIAFVAIGCVPKPTDKLVGTWKLDPASVSTGDAKVDAAMAANLAKATIDMKSDKTFTTGDGLSGTFALSDQTVTLTPSATAGKTGSDNQPLVGTLSADNTSFSVNTPGGKAMVFKKAAS